MKDEKITFEKWDISDFMPKKIISIDNEISDTSRFDQGKYFTGKGAVIHGVAPALADKYNVIKALSLLKITKRKKTLFPSLRVFF